MDCPPSPTRILDLLLLLMSAFFLYRAVSKYLEKKIAVEVRRDPQSSLNFDFPSVTLCSGFRQGDSLFNEFKNLSDDEVGNFDFESYLYQSSEFVHDIFAGTRINHTVHEWKGELSEFVHGQRGGRCVTFDVAGVNKSAQGQNREDNILIYIKTPKKKVKIKPLFQVFFHPKDAFIYNVANAFIGSSKNFMMAGKGKKVYVIGTKTERRNLESEQNNCDPKTNLTSYLGCLDSAWRSALGCRFPWDKPGNQSLDLCLPSHLRNLSKVDNELVRTIYWKGSGDLSAQSACAAPCNFLYYPVETKEFTRTLEEGLEYNTFIDFYYEDARLQVVDEYLAFDLLSLFGELGGGIGICLGWSIRSVLGDALAGIKYPKWGPEK